MNYTTQMDATRRGLVLFKWRLYKKRALMTLLITILLLVTVGFLGFAEGAKEVGQTAGQKVILKLGHGLPVSHPLNLAAEKFKELVEAKTDKMVQIDIFPANQMGAPREQLEQTLTGVLDIAIVTIDLPTFLDEPYWRLLESGYFFQSYEHARSFFNSSLFKELTDKLERDKGILVIGTPWYYGLRNLTTAKKPIKNPEDLKGLKIRVPPAPGYLNTLKGMGANVTPVAFNELYMALKTGIVDGQENPFATIYEYKYYEAQKYLNLTEHLQSYNAAFANAKKIKSLPADYQQAIFEAMQEAADYNDKLIRDSEADYLKKLIEVGMVVVESDKKAFRDRTIQFMQQEWYTPEEYAFYTKVQAIK